MKKEECANIKSEIITDLQILSTELFSLPLNPNFLELIANGLEEKLLEAMRNKCFDEDTIILLRNLIWSIRDLVKTLNTKEVDSNKLNWFRISINFLLVKLK